MRKNAVIREIVKENGGLNYPRGIYTEYAEGEDYSLYFVGGGDKATVAYSPLPSSIQSGFRAVADKKYAASVCAVAVACGGVDTGGGITEEKAKNLSLGYERKFSLRSVLPLFVGKTGAPCRYENLSERISSTSARPLPFEGAYSFYLGDFSCRFGYAYQPQNAFFALTTDVNISKQMLARALETETREIFSSLKLPFLPTATDAVCIVTSGAVGNPLIDYEDTDYKKFSVALHTFCLAVATEFCLRTGYRVTECAVNGALSKKTARAVSRSLALAVSLQRGAITGTSVLNAIASSSETINAKKISVTLASANGLLHLVEEGVCLLGTDAHIQKHFSERESVLAVSLGDGNYNASSWCTTEKE